MRGEKAYQRRKAENAAAEKQKQTQRLKVRLAEPIVIFTGMLVVATLFLVGIGWLQWRTLGKTDQTLKAAQRPWISIGVPQPVSDFQYTDTGAIVTIEYYLTNSGNSPALNVEMDGEMPLVQSYMGIYKRQDAICDRLRTRLIGNRGDGFTIFPHDPALPQRVQYSVGKEALDAALKAGQFPVPAVMPMIIGCVRYVFYADVSQHDTGFIYVIQHIPPMGWIRTDLGNIPKKELLLITPNFGSGRTN
jgi:hypothetical protein